MAIYTFKKLVQKLRPRYVARLLRRRRNRRLATAVSGLAGVILLITVVVPSSPTKIEAAAYTPLLDVIAKGESSGNYNAYYASPDNASIRFTDMSVAEVLRWQEDYVNQGSFSSAVGRYQIIRPTLLKLVHELNVDTNLRFDQPLQDRMAIALLERRGSVDYVDDRLSREQFAANLAQEWAALPKVTGPNPDQSYYAADGVNKSRITADEILGAIMKLNK